MDILDSPVTATMSKPRRRDRGEVGVVDLNTVFNDLDDDGDYEVFEGVASEREGDAVASGDDDCLICKERGVAKLVTVKDNIPEDKLEAMLSSNSFRQGSTSLDGPVLRTSCGDPVTPSLGPVALILVPTRELAMQIHSHLSEVAKYTNVKVREGRGGKFVYL